jgi:hypothetical protein
VLSEPKGYAGRCAGLTGWTTGLQIALRNFQENIASRLTGLVPTGHDVIQTGDTLVLRGSYEVTHSGEFLGVPRPAGGFPTTGSTSTGSPAGVSSGGTCSVTGKDCWTS